jgi:hypothetical protein
MVIIHVNRVENTILAKLLHDTELALRGGRYRVHIDRCMTFCDRRIACHESVKRIRSISHVYHALTPSDMLTLAWKSMLDETISDREMSHGKYFDNLIT